MSCPTRQDHTRKKKRTTNSALATIAPAQHTHPQMIVLQKHEQLFRSARPVNTVITCVKTTLVDKLIQMASSTRRNAPVDLIVRLDQSSLRSVTQEGLTLLQRHQHFSRHQRGPINSRVSHSTTLHDHTRLSNRTRQIPRIHPPKSLKRADENSTLPQDLHKLPNRPMVI